MPACKSSGWVLNSLFVDQPSHQQANHGKITASWFTSASHLLSFCILNLSFCRFVVLSFCPFVFCPFVFCPFVFSPLNLNLYFVLLYLLFLFCPFEFCIMCFVFGLLSFCILNFVDPSVTSNWYKPPVMLFCCFVALSLCILSFVV